ncbi:DctP family TRAP transporter solute-binding subunit [Acetomicrobium sp. UBA5826]|uniref:DctP family TRAP transporter solute-binding subunit n=1 Tax=Acetomicrobium sp. UBA5826 TaxID=1946039 RepID=UPI0025811DBA|nr:DctP family TRAP transporter solute-binding subunit [Acetomicrobium sp. UBA5826]
MFKKNVFNMLVILIAIIGFLTSGESSASNSVVVAQLSNNQATGEIKTFLLGHILSANDDDPYQVFATNFAKNVEEMSAGKMKIQVIPNAQLGGERDMMEGMQFGTIQMCVQTNVNTGIFASKFLAFDLPFIFNNAAQAYKILDGPLGREVLDSLEPLGIKGLAWGEGGFRHMINKVRPIRVPSDVKGLKFRSLENPLYVDTYKALGTNPTPMAWTETFTALQQGTIDGMDIPINVIKANRFYEVAKYLSLTSHFYSPLYIAMSKNIWDSLSAEEQSIMMKAAKKAGDDERKFVQQNEELAINMMKAQGLQVNSDVDFAAFGKALSPVYEKYKDKIGTEFFNRLIQALK